MLKGYRIKVSELEAELKIKESEINILRLSMEKFKSDMFSMRNLKTENDNLANELNKARELIRQNLKEEKIEEKIQK